MSTCFHWYRSEFRKLQCKNFPHPQVELDLSLVFFQCNKWKFPSPIIHFNFKHQPSLSRVTFMGPRPIVTLALSSPRDYKFTDSNLKCTSYHIFYNWSYKYLSYRILSCTMPKHLHYTAVRCWYQMEFCLLFDKTHSEAPVTHVVRYVKKIKSFIWFN